MNSYHTLLSIISKNTDNKLYKTYIDNNIEIISEKLKILSNSINNIIKIADNTDLNYITKITNITNLLNINNNQAKYILDLVTLNNLSKHQKKFIQKGGAQVCNLYGGESDSHEESDKQIKNIENKIEKMQETLEKIANSSSQNTPILLSAPNNSGKKSEIMPGIKINGLEKLMNKAFPGINGEEVCIDPRNLHKGVFIMMQNLPELAFKNMCLFPVFVMNTMNAFTNKFFSMLGINTMDFIDFKKPLDFIYLLLFATASIPYAGAVSNLIIIIKAIFDGRIFLASVVSMTTIVSLFMYHMVDMGLILKVIYALDVHSYNQYAKKIKN